MGAPRRQRRSVEPAPENAGTEHRGQVEGWPFDHKIEARNFANAREIGLRVLGEYLTELPLKLNSQSENCGYSRKNSAIA
jgi:hypothetical protein